MHETPKGWPWPFVTLAVRAAPLGLCLLSDLLSQGFATFADSRRSTLGWHRNVPLALKRILRRGLADRSGSLSQRTGWGRKFPAKPG